EEQRLTLMGAHQERPRRHSAESDREQAVVNVGQPQPLREPGRDQRDDRTEQYQWRQQGRGPGLGALHSLIVADGTGPGAQVYPGMSIGGTRQGNPRSATVR